MNLKRQLGKWYALEFLTNFSLHEGVSIVLLLLRGFTLLDFGIAEGFFHVASLLFEVPSGMLADVLGRKKVLMLSQLSFLIFSLLMAFCNTLFGIIIAYVFCALGYSAQSGTREAICYESLDECGQSDRFLRVMGNGSALYSIAGTIGSLCSGIALAIGNTWAYLVKGVISLFGAGTALTLKEPEVSQKRTGNFTFKKLGVNMKGQFVSAFTFLKHTPDAFRIMAVSALVGAVKTLSMFYIQDMLSASSGRYIGVCLVAIGLGPVAGAKLALLFDKHSRLSSSFFWGALLAGGGVAFAAAGKSFWFMIAGGFLLTAFDTVVDLCSTNALNVMIPSDTRATLISASSMVFSIFMLPMSPLSGLIADSYSTRASFLCMAMLLALLALFILVYKVFFLAKRKKEQ